MSRRGLSYSQIISWLKVLLPVVALALLSTMFLFSQSISPTSAIPFAKVELQERARDQRITAPFFSGQTTSGFPISVTAETAKPDQDNPRLTHADELKANITLADDNVIDLDAKSAQINSFSFEVLLRGDVQLNSTNGYAFTTEALALNLNQGSARSDTQVTGTGPAGTFTAGAMELTYPEDGEKSRFLFTNGVKLIYKPQ